MRAHSLILIIVFLVGCKEVAEESTTKQELARKQEKGDSADVKEVTADEVKINAVHASKLANQGAKLQFDKEPFSPGNFERKTAGDLIIFTAVVPFNQVDELKAEVLFNGNGTSDMKLSILTSRVVPERSSEKNLEKMRKIFPPRSRKIK